MTRPGFRVETVELDLPELAGALSTRLREAGLPVTPERVVEIVRRRVKDAPQTLAVQVANAVSRMRASDVQKPPGIAEAIDWLSALNLLGVQRLDAAVADRTLGSVLKYAEDQEVVRGEGLERLVSGGD